jgi:hypothetical protein
MHLLAHQYHPGSPVATVTPCILSPFSLASLFEGTLNDDCKRSLSAKIGSRFLGRQDSAGALDWSTAMVVYTKDDLRAGRHGTQHSLTRLTHSWLGWMVWRCQYRILDRSRRRYRCQLCAMRVDFADFRLFGALTYCPRWSKMHSWCRHGSKRLFTTACEHEV